jgi:hypothetical protein
MAKIKNRHDALANKEARHMVKTNAHKAGHLKIDHHNKRSQGKRHKGKKTIL